MTDKKIQTILIPKSKFSLEEAKKWLKKHKYKIKYYGKDVDITENYYRFRQAAPNPRGKTIEGYYTYKLDNDIKIVYYKLK